MGIIALKTNNNNSFGCVRVQKMVKIILKYESILFDIVSVHRVSKKREKEREHYEFIRKHQH